MAFQLVERATGRSQRAILARADDLLDDSGDERRGVKEHGVGEVGGKPRRQGVHGGAYPMCHVDGIRPWRLVANSAPVHPPWHNGRTTIPQ